MFKDGYQTCVSCHVSPSGGGALSPYGRMISEEILSTWYYKGESNVAHFDYESPSWLGVGGDLRSVFIRNNENVDKFIGMQRDVDLAILLGPVAFASSYGIYNEKNTESRRHYGTLTVGDNLTLRGGKFLPSYGIHHPDHTAFNRSPLGLGQGNESYNLEVSTRGKLGEVFLTGIALTKDGEEYTTKNTGNALRVNAFLTTWLQTGVSWMGLTNQVKYGGFAQLAFGKWFYASLDVNEIPDPEPIVLSYGKVSFTPWRGINIIYENNLSKDLDAQVHQDAFGLQWFPRPHFEWLAKAITSEDEWSYLILSHYYL